MGELTESEIENDIEEMKETGTYASFKEAFVEFLLDDSLTLVEKNELYLGGTMDTDLQTWNYLKWLWSKLAPNEPWPLEGRPAPEDA